MLDAAPVDLALADCADIGHRVQLVNLRRSNRSAPICVNKAKPMATQRRRQLLQRIKILIRGNQKRLHPVFLSAKDGTPGASLLQSIVRSPRFPVLKPLVPLYAKKAAETSGLSISILFYRIYCRMSIFFASVPRCSATYFPVDGHIDIRQVAARVEGDVFQHLFKQRMQPACADVLFRFVLQGCAACASASSADSSKCRCT